MERGRDGVRGVRIRGVLHRRGGFSGHAEEARKGFRTGFRTCGEEAGFQADGKLGMKPRDARKVINHNAAQIAKLIEFTDASQRGTAGSTFNLEVVKKKASKSPMSAFAERFWSDPHNVHAAIVLQPYLYKLSIFNGIRRNLYEPFFLVERDPNLLRDWRKRQTAEQREMHDRFQEVCRIVAQALYYDTRDNFDGPIKISVEINRDDQEVDTNSQAAARDREEAKRPSNAMAHQIRYSQFREIEEDEELNQPEPMSREAAKGVWQQRHNMSIRTIEDSIRFCEKHEWPDGAPVKLEFRYQGISSA